MEPPEQPKVAYVLGVYRSGTTLLSNLMGQLDGFFCVGELRAIWRELGLATARCGCGMPLGACETWQHILGSAYGGMVEARKLAPQMLSWQRQALREKHTWQRVPALLRHRQLGSIDESARRYAGGMADLYRAIARVTEARVIVDSSKEPTDAAMIRLLPAMSAYFIQIVRDPRGTVFSAMRARAGGQLPPGSHWARSGYTAMSWMAGNFAAAAVCRVHGPERSMRIRYEDLVQMPDLTLERIAQLVGEPVEVPMSQDGSMVMAPTHTVCGNENRFRVGPVHLAQDTAWRNNLRPLARYVTTAVCAPLMISYGYQLNPGWRRYGSS
ncbi:MAG: sulfotransferase family protein [Actinomycetota bacterium]